MIKIPKILTDLVQAFLSLNWLVGLMRVVVENTVYCFTWTDGNWPIAPERKNAIESFLEIT